MINPNPNCDQECRFSSDGGSTTCMGWTDTYDKNGNLVTGGNPNYTTEVIKCHTCGRSWTTESQNGKTLSTKELLFG